MTFTEAMQAYINTNGNVDLQPNDSTDEDNNHYFNATYVHLLGMLGSFERVNRIRYTQDYARSCALQPGLFSRSPGNTTRLISHDEMIGIAACSLPAAKNIVAYGKRHFWCFNNLGDRKPTLRSWQGRFLSPIAYYYLRAGLPLTLFQKLKVALHLWRLSKSPPGDTSGLCLMLIMVSDFASVDSWLIRKAIKAFKSFCTAQYGDRSGLYSIYYGPKHPFAIYTKGLPF